MFILFCRTVLNSMIFFLRKARDNCRDLAHNRAPKNELTYHVSVPYILSIFFFSINYFTYCRSTNKNRRESLSHKIVSVVNLQVIKSKSFPIPNEFCLIFISLYCPLPKIWSLKNTGGEKTTRHLKTNHPI
jgi:hypothetical protein